MHAATRRARRFRRGVLLGMVLLLAASREGGISSDALMGHSEASAGNAFAAGSVALSTGPTSTVLTATGMTPGSVVSGPLTLSNAGTLQIRYAMQTAVTNPDGKGLGGQLQMTIREPGTSCATFDGTLLYAGPLSAAAFGSTASGVQPGDRLLSPASSEVLCLRVTLPVSTPVAYQAAAATATFTFTAEQATHNP